MIPRILHHIWVGPRPLPEEWVGPWRSAHPTWEYRLWREADLAGLSMINQRAFDDYMAQGCWHGASDIARVEILREHGGVYVDVDSKPLRSFEGAPFMAAGFFAGYEPIASLPGRIANGTIGAEAHHPIIDTYARLISEMTDLSEPWLSCGAPGLMAAVYAHLACCKPMILPARTFYATDAHGRVVPGKEIAYSQHFWATSNHSYAIKAVILVPRRADGGRRDQTWEFVKSHWGRLGWPIVEGHHDEGPFNAAAARNEAARLAGTEWEVAVFVDADTIMFDHEPVKKAVKIASVSGHLVRPYNKYWMVNEAAANGIMATGRRGISGIRPHPTRESHGGVNVVPRRLFEAVGGYDERFQGWGSEDTAFEIACTKLGGFDRIAGEVFHLWHPISSDRSTGDPGFQRNVALRRRYESIKRPDAMRALLEERSGGPVLRPDVAAVVITNGRRDCISVTIPSMEQMVGPFADGIICDDSGDPSYVEWLKETFPGWRVLAHEHVGHGPAVRFAIREAAKLDVDWLFWSEDDYEFPGRIDLGKIIATMENVGDDLKQMSIKRQAWFPAEVAAGPTVIDRFDQRLFVERSDNGSTWLEHREFYTLNPHVVRRTFLRAVHWPVVPNSEHHFGRVLFRDKRTKCGIWGARTDPPLAIHSGERAGTGY